MLGESQCAERKAPRKMGALPRRTEPSPTMQKTSKKRIGSVLRCAGNTRGEAVGNLRLFLRGRRQPSRLDYFKSGPLGERGVCRIERPILPFRASQFSAQSIPFRAG